jgi:hypothetical protein
MAFWICEPRASIDFDQRAADEQNSLASNKQPHETRRMLFRRINGDFRRTPSYFRKQVIH